MAAAKPYTMEQTEGELRVLLPLPAAVKAKDVVFKLTPSHLTLGVKGEARCARRCGCIRSALACAHALTLLPRAVSQPPVIDEPLWGTAKTDDSLWEVETRGGQRTLVLTVAKASNATWDFLLKSEARGPSRRRGAYAARSHVHAPQRGARTRRERGCSRPRLACAAWQLTRKR
jgi:hypothetical protein